jgi:tripartite-type tricarboxylate transporter receptor subunit TctC
VKPLAVSTARRIAALPEVPTIAEAGYPNAESTFWLAMLAPAKTPTDIVGKLNAEVLRALQSAELKERLAKLGTEAMSMTPAESDAFIRREYDVLGKVMRASGAMPQ